MWLNYINSQNTNNSNTNKTEDLRLVIIFIRLGVVAQTDDGLEYYENIELIFICFLCRDRELLAVENFKSDVATFKIITTAQKWLTKRE